MRKITGKLTLDEARKVQAQHPRSRVIVDEPAWTKSGDDRFDPDHPRHRELLISIPVYVVVTDEREETVSIDLAPHGEFVARLADVRHAHRTYSKRQLINAIVDGYGGGCGLASTKRHWAVYAKWELAIVYNGMVHPVR